jgi:1-acyl-sn-glycerol-3-phosphate acyltransferase
MSALATLRATVRAAALILWILLMVLPMASTRYMYMRRSHRTVMRMLLRGALQILNIRAVAHQRPRKPRSTLFISNHASYLDVLALGAVLPVTFTPKIDIKHWPIIGPLATISGAIFIHRSAPLKSLDQQQMLQDHLFLGENISLFAEGTTSDGSRVLRFKSALFRAAKNLDVDDPPIQVVPVAIVYTQLNHRPITTQAERDILAWHGDMELIPHLWELLKQRGARIELFFYPATTYAAFDSRKDLATHCQQVIEQGVMEALGKHVDNESMAS